MLPFVVGEQRSSAFWRLMPDREPDPDAELTLCVAQRSVAFAARRRAREGKSSIFSRRPLTRGKGGQHGSKKLEVLTAEFP